MSDFVEWADDEDGLDSSSEIHWTGMPEFEQGRVKPEFSKLTIRFRTEEDLNDFAKTIGQNITPQTKSIWHPYKSHYREEQKEWVDES